MDAIHGISFGFIGTLITIIGFYIAYNIAYKTVMKKDKKKQKGPLDDLKKYLPGWKGDDCQ